MPSSPLPVTTATTSPKAGAIDHDDLLAQLAEAEMEQGSPMTLDASSSLVTPTPGDNASSVIGEGSNAVGSGKDESDVVSMAAGGGGGDGKERSPEADKEFQADSSPSVGHEGAPSNASVLEGAAGGSAVPAARLGKTPGKSTSTKPTAASLDDELSQLEELERELGIGGSTGGVHSAVGGSMTGEGGKPSPRDAEKDDTFDMENLDELEGYLESLAK